jgi:hypothetical protein
MSHDHKITDEAEQNFILEESERYYRAAHAMQSGVAYEMSQGCHDTEPKHLRVGINAAMVEHSALVELLIAKGILTRREYFTSVADEMENEVKRYEARSLIGAKFQ